MKQKKKKREREEEATVDMDGEMTPTQTHYETRWDSHSLVLHVWWLVFPNLMILSTLFVHLQLAHNNHSKSAFTFFNFGINNHN